MVYNTSMGMRIFTIRLPGWCEHYLSVNTSTETPRYSDPSGVILIEMSLMEEPMKSLEKLDDKAMTELCEDYAAYTRVNISEEHGQVVTQMAAIEEQISTFSEMLTDIQANKYGIGHTRNVMNLNEYFSVSF